MKYGLFIPVEIVPEFHEMPLRTDFGQKVSVAQNSPSRTAKSKEPDTGRSDN